jgi:hypothetical protein
MPFTLARGPGGDRPRRSTAGSARRRWVEALTGLRALDGSSDHQITRHGEDEIESPARRLVARSQTFLFYHQAEAMRGRVAVPARQQPASSSRR